MPSAQLIGARAEQLAPGNLDGNLWEILRKSLGNPWEILKTYGKLWEIPKFWWKNRWKREVESWEKCAEDGRCFGLRKSRKMQVAYGKILRNAGLQMKSIFNAGLWDIWNIWDIWDIWDLLDILDILCRYIRGKSLTGLLDNLRDILEVQWDRIWMICVHICIGFVFWCHQI